MLLKFKEFLTEAKYKKTKCPKCRGRLVATGIKELNNTKWECENCNYEEDRRVNKKENTGLSASQKKIIAKIEKNKEFEITDVIEEHNDILGIFINFESANKKTFIHATYSIMVTKNGKIEWYGADRFGNDYKDKEARNNLAELAAYDIGLPKVKFARHV